jgi:hypothetical protein
LQGLDSALDGFEAKQRRREDNDNLYAVRAFSIEIAETPANYGLRHSVVIAPLKSHSIEPGQRRELGDICLCKDSQEVKPGELLLPVKDKIYVAVRANVDLVWKKLFEHVRSQENEVLYSKLWKEWQGARKAVSVDVGYFAGFRKKVNDKMLPCIPGTQVYFTDPKGYNLISILFECNSAPVL